MRGLAEVSTLANGSQMPSAGIFDPPYAINVNLTQLPIATKVSCLYRIWTTTIYPCIDVLRGQSLIK